jgi:S-adenosylmethionine synthetase
MKRLLTSESVTEGHPDKMADQISDAILDAILAKDPLARVAAETLLTTGMVVIVGEISTRCYVDIPKLVRATVRDIGYTRAKFGFDSENCAVLTSLDEQSPDIAMGVDRSLETRAGAEDIFETTGAGDQGMMFGYATNETPEYMPMTAILASKLAMRLAEVRKTGLLSYLRPDGKTQVTIEYEDHRPLRVDTVVVSAQHDPDADMDRLKADLVRHVVEAVIPAAMIDADTKYLINPTGRFVIGGPQGDSGLTGRKIITDTYGGMARHGGGAFSGKDPTKVDRSASYAARYVAKNVVAAGLADRCELQVAYAIGVARPVSVAVDTFGTCKIPEEQIAALITRHFDLRPAAIIDYLELRKPKYKKTAAYGHFGRDDADFLWEKTDKAELLRKEAGLSG